MAYPRSLLPKSVAVRLYAGGMLAFLAVSIMALAALTFARHTETAARHFFDYGLDAVAYAAQIELLLERHRRIIETAPVDLDRMEIAKNESDSRALLGEIEHLLADARDPSLAALTAQMPALRQSAAAVLHFARNYAQDRALAEMEQYSRSAQEMLAVVRRERSERMSEAKEDVERLTRNSDTLVAWVVASAVIALLLIGPISLFLVRSVVRRLHRITIAMRRLARNDTGFVVEAVGDADEVGEMARAVQIFQRNAVELLDQQKALQQLNVWLDIALNNMARGLSMFDAEQRLLLCNQRYREIYGLDEASTRAGTPLADIIASYAEASARGGGEEPAAAADWLAMLRDTLAEGKPVTRLRSLADGRSLSVSIQPLAGGGWVDLHEDVTEKKVAEERITRLVQVDTLTEVANRRYFHERLELLCEAGSGATAFAVHWIDLDRFKEVNDTLGHPVGDALLKQVAGRLTGIVRGGDLVARLGGDEFAIIQAGVAREEQAEALARRLLAAIAEPFFVLEQRIVIGTSIGIVLAPGHGSTPDDLLKNADIALYRAKSAGRGNAVFYHPDQGAELKQRRALEVDLERALAEGQLELHYQPIVCLATGTVISCEALMRWRHPEQGMIPPGRFIPIAEECGLIVELGAWAIRQACLDAAAWPLQARVAVNLSAVQFGSQDLLHITGDALRAAGLPPERLEFEVTESLLLEDDSRTIELLHALRASGVSIALDDFGTGFASLSYLRSFPFDKIKIDQTFVRDLPQRDDCAAIVRAVTGLAHMLDMRTVAEGVETAQHLRLVRSAGCHAAQGYFLSRPVPPAQLAAAFAGCRAVFEQVA